MVKRKRLNYLCGLMLIVFCACNKSSSLNSQGGLLPTHYIQIGDSTFSPANLTEANGASFTFLNSTGIAHTIMSDDSTTLKAVLIEADSSYYFKPDTATTVPVQIYIPYHCVEHPSAKGVIILNP